MLRTRESRRVLVTGAAGLIGSEVTVYFGERGFSMIGVDNNMRADFFGPQGDTGWNRKRLQALLPDLRFVDLDIRDRKGVLQLIEAVKPHLIVHCAAQPSHDLAAQRPFDDFEVNAGGTLNLLEAARRSAPEAVFVHMSTNKVYGDAPNQIELTELETRWDYADAHYRNGIREDFQIDKSKHSLFGASKLASDIMVQEYGRYFGLRTCCLRGGCLTGPNHAGVELHGFLSYLVKCNVTSSPYTIFGYKGKQVRDNIHAFDVATFIHQFLEAPRVAEVYNLGGGRQNSCSILEAFDAIAEISGREMVYTYSDNARSGDHICYISDLSKMRAHYPEWNITKTLDLIFQELHESWIRRLALGSPVTP